MPRCRSLAMVVGITRLIEDGYHAPANRPLPPQEKSITNNDQAANPKVSTIHLRAADVNDHVPAFGAWQEGAHTGARRTLCPTTNLGPDVGADPGS